MDFYVYWGTLATDRETSRVGTKTPPPSPILQKMAEKNLTKKSNGVLKASFRKQINISFKKISGRTIKNSPQK